MDKNSTSKFLQALDSLKEFGHHADKLIRIVRGFYQSYQRALGPESQKEIDRLFFLFLELLKKQCSSPYDFEPFHRKLRKPVDYYEFGKDFLRPLFIEAESTIRGISQLRTIEKQLAAGENVIFLANHQTEADPQLIALLMEKEFPKLGEQMIFVAGERVTTDPLAVPFSLGCDLLCIYSKRYIDRPPELKMEKQLHNKKTMGLMGQLLKEGGKCIYVAPSGGRDRRNFQGDIEIAPFDPKSIEMFYLMVKKSKTPTSFYPMALKTYDILPPPRKVEIELGEERFANRVPIHMAIGDEIDMEHFPNSDHVNKMLRRKSRSDYIWALVKKDYSLF